MTDPGNGKEKQKKQNKHGKITKQKQNKANKTTKAAEHRKARTVYTQGPNQAATYNDTYLPPILELPPAMQQQVWHTRSQTLCGIGRTLLQRNRPVT